MNRDPQTRMTNDEIRRTNGMAHPSALWHSGFGFLWSFVIRHSSFHDRFMVPMHSKHAEGALHEPTLVWSPAFRRLRVARPAEAGTPCDRKFMVPMHSRKRKRALHEQAHRSPLSGMDQAFVCEMPIPLLGTGRGGFMVATHSNPA